MAEGEATPRGRLNHRSDARSSLLPPNYTISESKARERHRGVKAAKKIPRVRGEESDEAEMSVSCDETRCEKDGEEREKESAAELRQERSG